MQGFDPATGEGTTVLKVGDQEVTLIVLNDARRRGLRVMMPNGLMVGSETQHGTNRECRERVRFEDGSGCVCTVAHEAGWQNAHSHVRAREWFTVVTGRVCLVERDHDGALTGRIYEAGQAFETTPGRSHNLYVFAGAIFLTVKYGGEAKDWVVDTLLDAASKSLSEADLLVRFSSI